MVCPQKPGTFEGEESFATYVQSLCNPCALQEYMLVNMVHRPGEMLVLDAGRAGYVETVRTANRLHLKETYKLPKGYSGQIQS